MASGASDLATYGYAFTALIHAAFGAHLARIGYLKPQSGRASQAFVVAVVASALWAGLLVLDRFTYRPGPGQLANVFDLLRYAGWFAFLLLLVRPLSVPAGPQNAIGLRRIAAAAVVVTAMLMAARAMDESLADQLARPYLALWLALPVIGLVLVEQLFRNLPEDSRWNAKPVCLGLGCVFLFDVFVYSEAVLFGRFDRDAEAVRGVVHVLAVPLLLLATRRRADWIRRLQVSRTAAFYSASLLLAGLYLLFMAAIGYYVRFFGGDWGRALQLALLFSAVIFLGVLALSGSLRARIRVFLGKHFFSYRYDYREEWLRFTAMLSSKSSPQEVGALVIRGLANMVECPAGSLWTQAAGEAAFRETARWNLPPTEDRESDSSSFSTFLRGQGWVIDLDEYRAAPRRYVELTLPNWLLTNPNLWLVVPLLVGDTLTGFVVLARPRTPMELNWEVRDLLKTASRQAAGFMAQMQATEGLLEARKFDAFNKMSAFVVHDLKNIVTQLSLMLKNAERLHDNREFQQDMLLTVESSLEKMRRLMLQLREGATPPGGARGVELQPIVRRLESMAAARGRSIDVEVVEKLATRGHEERLERVLGHVVQNAFDATPADGRVWLRVERFGGQVKVDIGDTGVGMTEEFIQTQLFRPFQSTKANGMGIGTYESFQYIRELGGAISVDSKIGQGTLVSIQMPLFDARTASDLQMPGSAR